MPLLSNRVNDRYWQQHGYFAGPLLAHCSSFVCGRTGRFVVGLQNESTGTQYNKY